MGGCESVTEVVVVVAANYKKWQPINGCGNIEEVEIEREKKKKWYIKQRSMQTE